MITLCTDRRIFIRLFLEHLYVLLSNHYSEFSCLGRTKVLNSISETFSLFKPKNSLRFLFFRNGAVVLHSFQVELNISYLSFDVRDSGFN